MFKNAVYVWAIINNAFWCCFMDLFFYTMYCPNIHENTWHNPKMRFMHLQGSIMCFIHAQWLKMSFGVMHGIYFIIRNIYEIFIKNTMHNNKIPFMHAWCLKKSFIHMRWQIMCFTDGLWLIIRFIHARC